MEQIGVQGSASQERKQPEMVITTLHMYGAFPMFQALSYIICFHPYSRV